MFDKAPQPESKKSSDYESLKNILEKASKATKLTFLIGFTAFLSSCSKDGQNIDYPSQDTISSVIEENPDIERLESQDVEYLRELFEEAGDHATPWFSYNEEDTEALKKFDALSIDNDAIEYTIYRNYKDMKDGEFSLTYRYEQENDSVFIMTLTDGGVLEQTAIDAKTGAVISGYTYDFYNEDNTYQITSTGEVKGTNTFISDNLESAHRGLLGVKEGIQAQDAL